MQPRPFTPNGLTAQAVDRLWGGSKAIGGGPLGLTARLSESRADSRLEVSRPACDHTHAISIWVTGSTHSELKLNGKTRFSRVREHGTFQIARAGESVETRLKNRKGKCLDLYLPDSVIKGCLEQDFQGGGSGFELLELGVERDPEITRLARAVQIELEAPSVAAAVAIDSAALALCVALIRRWSNHREVAKGSRASVAPWKIRRVADRMRTSLAEQLTLTELAASVGLSPYHFLRVFKASVGIPPHSYQMQLRLQRTLELLETTRLSVSEIAAEVGYDDPSYLARLFRKHFGTTPAAYRRARRS